MSTTIRTPMDAAVTASTAADAASPIDPAPAPNVASQVSRRSFLKTGGTALVLGFVVPRLARAQDAAAAAHGIMTPEAASAAGIQLNAFVSIDTAGKVTLVTHRAEMGQGAYSVVPQILAEELEVDLAAIAIVVAEGDPAKYGSQLTGGSSTVRGGITQLLKTGATARDMLVRAAAARWGVPADSCKARMGQVTHAASGRTLGYGALVEDAAKLTPNKDVALKERKDWTLIGKPVPRQDTPLKVNGSAKFGIDVRLPGMLYAVVERSPRFVGKVKSFDASKALLVPGVKHVVKTERDIFGNMREGVAVVATSTWAAIKGRRALIVEWDDTGIPDVSSASLAAALKSSLAGKPLGFKSKGDVAAALGATPAVDVTYETPYQAHACMEPINCTAHVTDTSAEIWGPVQAPDWNRGHLAGALKLAMEQVKVNMTFLGGGFGRKAFTDFPLEAALVSKAVKAPVQVVWTREDDLSVGPFRPGAMYHVRGALKDGKISAIEMTMAAQNLMAQEPGDTPKKPNDNVTEGLPETYLETIPNYQFGDIPLQAPVPVMWWRSVYSSTNGFAYESFLDEMARAAKMDPIAFRRQHFDSPRLHALADKLEAVSGWKQRKAGEGYGMSLTYCFSSWAAHVVKVSKAKAGGITIDKVWTVMDCGVAVNPDVIRQQVEGSIVMALGAATTHEVTFAKGSAVEKNFDKYPLPRLRDIPPIEVHIMDNGEAAGGAGEPALPGFTPALTNAIFDLTGTRVRKLPFDLKKV